jgi:cystathionine beta-lyase
MFAATNRVAFVDVLVPEMLDALEIGVLRQRRSAKWTAYPDDVIPAWVAEMDFPLADPIRERLRAAIEAGDLGYPAPDRCGAREALAEWLARSHGWAPDPEAILVLPDAMRGVELALLAHTAPGDAIAVPTPVYPPFLAVVREHGRRLVEVELARSDGRFALDLDGLAAALADGARMILLCHPHNPTGHVNEREDLVALAELAAAHAATVLSDEIHAPLILDGSAHVPFSTVSAAAAACAVTVTSTSKAWNIPGLRTAFLIAEDEAMRAPILELGPRARMGCSILGLEATITALRCGGPWLDAVLGVLARNARLVVEAVASSLPGVEIVAPRATYLAWLDCRSLAVPDGPHAFFLERARVALSDGAVFGRGGDGHVRLNFATSHGLLAEILERMAHAVREHAASV